MINIGVSGHNGFIGRELCKLIFLNGFTLTKINHQIINNNSYFEKDLKIINDPNYWVADFHNIDCVKLLQSTGKIP